MKKNTAASTARARVTFIMIVGSLLMLSSFGLQTTFAAASTDNNKCPFSREVNVSIANSLPKEGRNLIIAVCGPLKGQGTGPVVIGRGKSFNFSRCPNERPAYLCGLVWWTKQVEFNVYDDKDGGCQAHTDDDVIICSWEAKADGIYLGGKKKYDWD